MSATNQVHRQHRFTLCHSVHWRQAFVWGEHQSVWFIFIPSPAVSCVSACCANV